MEDHFRPFQPFPSVFSPSRAFPGAFVRLRELPGPFRSPPGRAGSFPGRFEDPISGTYGLRAAALAPALANLGHFSVPGGPRQATGGFGPGREAPGAPRRRADPVNALLNYGCGILMSRAWAALLHAGLVFLNPVKQEARIQPIATPVS